MSLAKQYGADRIWIVNVGHFKGYEFPTEYFLSLAWDTNALDRARTSASSRGCGPRASSARPYAGEIADIIDGVDASSTAAGSPSCSTRPPTACVNYQRGR